MLSFTLSGARVDVSVEGMSDRILERTPRVSVLSHFLTNLELREGLEPITFACYQ